MASTEVEEREGLWRKRVRHYASIILLLPLIPFMYDVSNKEWIDADGGFSLNPHLDWARPVYYLIAVLCGALSGIILTRYPQAVPGEWVAGVIGGAIGAFCALGLAVLYLDNVNRAYNLVEFLMLMIGGIPGFLVWYGIREKCLRSRNHRERTYEFESPPTATSKTSDSEVV
jgi:hypothetical protein